MEADQHGRPQGPPMKERAWRVPGLSGGDGDHFLRWWIPSQNGM